MCIYDQDSVELTNEVIIDKITDIYTYIICIALRFTVSTRT